MEFTDLIVDVVHGVQKEGHLALGVEADTVHHIMPLPVISMKPVNVSRPSLELMVPITNEEHSTRKGLQVRVQGQFGLKLLIH